MNSATPSSVQKIILAFVGMPGSGKSEAAAYIATKKIPFVRFGQITDEALQAKNLELNQENEKKFREEIRDELGMAAFAIKAKPKIDALLQQHNIIALDGLYSWEEYTYLHTFFPHLVVCHIYAQPKIRYKRLAKRPVRPIPFEESRTRDFMEIEHLNKGGPIAIADFMIENDGDLTMLHDAIDNVLSNLKLNRNV